MIIWLLPASLSFAAILERNPTKQTAVVADCVLDRFMKLRCVPGGMDVILAFAIFGILVRTSWTIFHRAIAIHGEANMALPADTPHPANLYPLKFTLRAAKFRCGCWPIWRTWSRMRTRMRKARSGWC
ncbi:hypothetical protein B0H14DRAFT_2986882, partial [Mycena olivaceomarginata]